MNVFIFSDCETPGSCQVLMKYSWVMVEGKKLFEVQLSGKSDEMSGGESYIAMAFSGKRHNYRLWLPSPGKGPTVVQKGHKVDTHHSHIL